MKLETIKKTLPLLLLMAMGNWACSDNNPIEEVGTETVPELSIEAEVHNTLLCNFYQSKIEEKEFSDNPEEEEEPPIKYVPSAGIVLDESRPSVRSAEAETYDAARNDFMSRIPDEEAAQTLITISDKEVCVNLGDYGSVKFSASNEDGSLAKAEVSLADARPYTLYYKPHAAFPDNDQDNQNLSKIYSPGTIIYNTKNGEVYLVTESSSYACYVIGDAHHAWYPVYDFWKDHFHFFKGAPTQGQWERIRRSWKINRDAFKTTYLKSPNCIISALVEIMEGGNIYKNVCVEGNDIGSHRHNFVAHPTWYSYAKLIEIDNLRKDKFNAAQRRYAEGYWLRDLDTYYVTYKVIERNDIKNYKILYPIH